MATLIQRLKEQVLQGKPYSGTLQELIAARIDPGNLDMAVFSAWKRLQKRVVTHLKAHIEEYEPQERIRIYTAMTEFDKKCCIPYLARRQMEENNVEAQELLRKLLTEFNFE